MKNSLKIALLSAGIFSFSQSHAQSHDDHNVGHEIGHTATKVGHKTSEIAAKGAAGATDKRYKNKWGPHNESIYIDKNSRYFYVDKVGHRNYLKKTELRDKPLR
jgi:hypothetical protein